MINLYLYNIVPALRLKFEVVAFLLHSCSINILIYHEKRVYNLIWTSVKRVKIKGILVINLHCVKVGIAGL